MKDTVWSSAQFWYALIGDVPTSWNHSMLMEGLKNILSSLKLTSSGVHSKFIYSSTFFFFYVLILMMYSKRKDRYFIGHYTNHSVYMPQFFIWHWKMTLGMSPHKKKKKKVLIPQNHTSFVQSNWTTSLCLYVGVTSTLSHHSIFPPVKSYFFFQQHQSVGQSLLSNPFSIDTVIRFIHYLSFL